MTLQTVVEASDYARHLYESEGFKFVEHYIVPLPEKWAERNPQKFDWMVRPARTENRKLQQ